MYAVTQDYKNSIYSNSRRIHGRVTFDISPIDLDSDTCTVTTSSEFYVSKASTQLNDNVRTQSFKLMTWENNRNLLDGTFSFADDTSSNWGQTGWVSANQSNGSNVMNETVTCTYGTTHTSAGITVTFDALTGEYASDFTVTAYDASNSVIYTLSVTNNTLIQRKVIAPLVGFKKITVNITKWCMPNRYARITEIDAGVVLVYTDDNLVRLSLTEEVDPIAANVSIPEFEFSIDNSSKEFDILNPSGIYTSLQQRQRIYAEMGLDLTGRTEYVPLGLFYLSEWRNDAGSLTATFRGRSKLDLLDLTNYSQSTPQVGYSLYTMAQTVLNNAGVTNYYIDSALSSISTNGLISSMTCREALQMIAIAAQATIRVTRDDVLRIETTRAGSAVDTLTFEEYLEEPRIDLNKQVQSVTVSYYTTLGTAAGSVSVTDATVQNGEVINVDGNTLINTNGQATAVANWLKSRRNERQVFKVNWRGNPAQDIYDRVVFQNRYVNTQNVFITKQELRYEGYLSTYVEARAVT